MKRMIMIGLNLLVCLSVSSVADALKTDQSPRQMGDNIMESIVGKEDLTGAFDLIKRVMVLSAGELEDVKNSAAQTRADFKESYGALAGLEFVDEKMIGEVLACLRYIERRERHGILWTFYFYKSPEGWLLDSFRWNSDTTVIFKEN